MAVNSARSMVAECVQGSIDCTYMQLTPNRANPDVVPVERLAWPTFANVEKFADPPHLEAHIQHAARPVEHKVRMGGDPRY